MIIIFCFVALLCIYFMKNKEYSLKVTMGGSTIITNDILNASKDPVNFIYKFDSIFSYLSEYVKDNDILYYNQETPISGLSLGISGDVCYNTPSNFAIDMMNIGFNMVSLANNHALDGRIRYVNGNYYCDRNELGINNNIDFWSKYEDVYYAGLYRNKGERNNIKIGKKNGISYAMLSYTYGTNLDGIVSYDSDIISIYNDEQVKKDVERVRNKVDILFVAMHWGEEYNIIPNNEQKRQAKYLASLGVDIVIGTHPQVIQPIEWIDNTLVIYSLANLVSSPDSDRDSYSNSIGVLVSIDVIKKNNKIKIHNINCELTYMSYEIKDNVKKNFKVIPFSYIAPTDKEKVDLYNQYSNIIRLYDKSIQINHMGTRSLQNIIE